MSLHPKVQNSSLTGALGVVVVYVLSELHVQLPPEVWVSFTVLVSAAVGWLTPSEKKP